MKGLYLYPRREYDRIFPLPPVKKLSIIAFHKTNIAHYAVKD
jgi:hypothetical protein